jgi:phage RecT family recombinase
MNKKSSNPNLLATNKTNAVKPSGEVLVKTLKRDLFDQRKTFAGLLGVPEDSQTFTSWLAEVAHVVGLSPKLLEANRDSLMQSLRHAITMGLSINPALGEAYLIPRWDKNLRANVVQCQRGYQGVLALMFRSDMVDNVFADVIYRDEVYKIYGGTNARIEHEPDVEGESRTNNFDDIVVAYANVYLKGSTRPVFVYLTYADLARARAMNLDQKGNPSIPWRDHPQAMSIKTALTRVCKLLPRHSKLAELHRALAAEADGTGISIVQSESIKDHGEQAPWAIACEAFGRFDVHPERLLTFLGIESGDDFTLDHDAALRDLHAQIRVGDWSQLLEASGGDGDGDGDVRPQPLA